MGKFKVLNILEGRPRLVNVDRIESAEIREGRLVIFIGDEMLKLIGYDLEDFGRYLNE